MLKRGLSSFRLLITVVAYARTSPSRQGMPARIICGSNILVFHGSVANATRSSAGIIIPTSAGLRRQITIYFPPFPVPVERMPLSSWSCSRQRNWVTFVTHGTTFTTPEAPLPHAPARKRTQPAPLFNGKRQRHLSSSTSSLSTFSSSSRESSAERHLADIGHNTEVEMAVSSLASYHDATGFDEPSVEGEIVVMGEEDKREREEMERKKRFEKERKEKV